MPRRRLPTNVFEAAIDRMVRVYEGGHRVVVSLSGGKDSTCVLGVCKIAAEVAGRLPVEAITRDEEIAFPGTYEYLERVAEDPDVELFWAVAHQPIINLFNRELPYWWVFDPRVPESEWVRPYPKYGREIPEINIEHMTIPARFPPPEGKELYAGMGLRVAESRGRLYGLFSSGGHVTKPNRMGVRGVRPIYDWSDGDVWRAILENKWDYNDAYTTFHQLGVKRRDLRIGPPTMTAPGLGLLQYAKKAWPRWFDRVAHRVPGTRTAVMFGRHALTPTRRLGETWEECFERECVAGAPAWIAERSRKLRDRILRSHRHHSSSPLPEVSPCYHCEGNIGCWKGMATVMFNGDPFCLKQGVLGYVEPEFFREGAGKWNGKPSF